MNFLLKNILLNFIKFYQKIISPVIPARCRYYPTCSNYGRQALSWHGFRLGSWLLIKRISKCHPLGGHGIDFVPLPLATYTYCYVCLDVRSAWRGKGRFVYRDYNSYVSRLNHLLVQEQR